MILPFTQNERWHYLSRISQENAIDRSSNILYFLGDRNGFSRFEYPYSYCQCPRILPICNQIIRVFDEMPHPENVPHAMYRFMSIFVDGEVVEEIMGFRLSDPDLTPEANSLEYWRKLIQFLCPDGL